MSTWQEDDETRTPPEGMPQRAGGNRDMTAGAGTGVGPRERDGDAEGDIVRGGRGGGASRVTRQSAGGGGGTSTSSRSLGRVLAALVAGLIIGGVATALYLQSTDDGGDETAFTNAIDETRYQAVILSNDKVYFGQLVSISDDFFELESAFFLRETRADADAEPVRALLPVNREIHAPDNTMLIRKSEVVLVENLAKDSPILTEIKRQKG